MKCDKNCFECNLPDCILGSTDYYLEHREAILKQQHERYFKLKDQGICVKCGHNKATEGRTKCVECSYKSALYWKRCMAKKKGMVAK